MKPHNSNFSVSLQYIILNLSWLFAVTASVFAVTPITFEKFVLEVGVHAGHSLAADFNHDGRMDFAVSAAAENDVHVFLQSANFEFVHTATLPVTGAFSVLATGDFNSDGNPDIAAKGSADLGIYFGNGFGGFSSTQVPMPPTADVPFTMLATDYTGDSNTDIVICHGNDSSVFRGDGTGLFVFVGNLPMHCTWVRESSFQGPDYDNQIPDLVGQGFFGTWVILDKGIEPHPVQGPPHHTWAGFGDFNGDSKTDFVGWAEPTILSLFAGWTWEYDPTYPFFFAHAGNFSSGSNLGMDMLLWNQLEVADLNFDGKLDIVTNNWNNEWTSSSLSAIPGDGSGNFGPPTVFAHDDGADWFVFADINSDSKPDILASSWPRNRVLIYINTTFQTPVGTNSTVTVDSTTFTFDEVISGGTTTVTSIDPSTAGDVPGGFALANIAFEVSTTATFTGDVTSCFTVSSVNVESEFLALRVLHNEGGTLVDRTSSHDFPNRKICATTTSFSPFYMARIGNSAQFLFDRTRAFKAGSTIPIKLRLVDEAGGNLSSAALPLYVRSIRKIGSNTTSSVSDPGESNPDSRFRFTTDQYHYNLKTSGLTAGRYVLSFYAGTETAFFYTMEFEVK